MLDEGEPDDEHGLKGNADAPPPLNPDPAPLGPQWLPPPKVCWLEMFAPESDVMCCARKEASSDISTPVRSLEGVVEGESPAEPGAVAEGTNVGNFLCRLGGSFRDPRTETGGLKSVGGRWGWCVRAMATEVVAAAAWRGAWMRGAQMTGVGEGGEGGMFCRRCAQWAMSRSCWTICWMISFSW